MEDFSYSCYNCRSTYPGDIALHHCKNCGEPLYVESGALFLEEMMDEKLSLKEGNMPLIEADHPDITILFKDESRNPTGSFKDRGSVVGVTLAVKFGYDKVGTVSTGNMAASISAYAARAGLSSVVLVRENTPPSKLMQASLYGATIMEVLAPYPDIYDASLSSEDILFVNSDHPFRVLGQMTQATEICRDLDWQPPDRVIVPIGAGGNACGIWKGLLNLKSGGLIDRLPKITLVDPEGCCPAYQAFSENRMLSRFQNPNTIATAIDNTYPPSGNRAIRHVRESGGEIVTVNDDEIRAAQLELARDFGLFVEPSSATVWAAMEKVKHNKGDVVVPILTGTGLKDVKGLVESVKTQKVDLGGLKTYLDNKD